jgi:hypothetical protein
MRIRPSEVAARNGLIERAALVAAGAPSGTISSWLSRGAIVEVIVRRLSSPRRRIGVADDVPRGGGVGR